MNTADNVCDEKVKGLPKAFSWLNATQFLGALNDNILKLLAIFFLINLAGQSQAGYVSAKAGAVFVLPFLLFSSFAGNLADYAGKRRIIVWIKGVEVLVTVSGAIAFFYGNISGLYAVMFLMGTHSAIFAPSKYGIVPELVDSKQLSLANGVMEASTYAAIIIGTATASLLSEISGHNYALAAVFCVGVALAGVITSRRIETSDGTPDLGKSEGKPAVFSIRDTLATFRYIGRDRELLSAVGGSAFFMFLAAFTQMNLIPYGMDMLRLTQEQSGYLFLIAALGIGAGSYAAGKMSGRNIEFGIVPLGSIGLTFSSASLYFIVPRIFEVGLAIFGLGFCAGLFIVPLQSFIQLRSPEGRRGEIAAASVFLNWVGVLFASALTFLLSAGLKYPADKAFAVFAGLAAILTLITLKLLPDFFVRFLVLLPAKVIYRIKVTGGDNVPASGPALLVSNHVSWVDAVLLSATQQRRIRFIMERSIYSNRLLNPLFRLLKIIPVSSRDTHRQIAGFYREARAALNDGYLVCIFAEGAITRNGMLQEFRPGFERLVRGTGYPVIPTYIGGAWGSIFSYAGGKLVSGLPKTIPYPVSVIFGKEVSSEAEPSVLRQEVVGLSTSYFDSLKIDRRPLGRLFVKSARKNWFAPAVSDTLGKKLTYGRLLAGAVALASGIGRKTSGHKNIGVLLPPCSGAVLANLAVTILGKVPVNLNYTASPDTFRSSAGQCGLNFLITSRAFVEKFPSLPLPQGVLYLEDLAAEITTASKLAAIVKTIMLPARYLVAQKGFNPDEPATIIFSSGSTGEPKGVVLSHHNIISNVEALRMVLRVSGKDNVCAALPFFHSFGFTGTLWLPLLSGFSAVYHTNPLDGAKIADVVRERRSTIMLATPTFLLSYLRRAERGDFSSLRLVVTGAEKLNKRTADAFEAKFGLRPLEGYGATEMSPVITLSLPDTRIDGVLQKGSKEGSVGQPVPGVSVRILDPEKNTALPPETEGLIMVKGPNLMRGYLGRPDLTKDVIHDGWYMTGDIGSMDNNGFLTITDRLSRFSKIGGEMVPHIAIEEELQNLLRLDERVLAVTTIPDEKKGERLVVLYTKKAGAPEMLSGLLRQSRLPNLWKPGRDSFFEIAALPLLGSGKLDIRGLKRMALEAVASQGYVLMSGMDRELSKDAVGVSI